MAGVHERAKRDFLSWDIETHKELRTKLGLPPWTAQQRQQIVAMFASVLAAPKPKESTTDAEQ